MICRATLRPACGRPMRSAIIERGLTQVRGTNAVPASGSGPAAKCRGTQVESRVPQWDAGASVRVGPAGGAEPRGVPSRAPPPWESPPTRLTGPCLPPRGRARFTSVRLPGRRAYRPEWRAKEPRKRGRRTWRGTFAHTLKGCARGIGVWRVAEAAEAVERAVTGRDPADLVDPLERLARAINETRVIAELLAAA
jgi:hypothetical protein